jgi:pimeloyl-ACP methyl ester carboxylesterase
MDTLARLFNILIRVCGAGAFTLGLAFWLGYARSLTQLHALVLAGDRSERLARLVLVACEAFDNYPPGLPGKTVGLAARVPGGLNALAQPLRLRVLRRLPVALGWMRKRPIPHEITDAWLDPLLNQRQIRRDLIKYAGSARKRMLIEATERLRAFDRPALVVWASEDRVIPREHGRRLAELLSQGRLVEISDSYSLIPEDQPRQLAAAIRAFVRETPSVPS